MTAESFIPTIAAHLHQEKGTPLEQVTADARLGMDLGLDSLDLVEMVIRLEDEYHITISEDAASQMQTVGDVAIFLAQSTVAA